MTQLPRFSVVDIETSGLSLRWHRILQVAVVTVADGQILDQWSSLVRLRWPWQRVGPRNVHHLDRRTLRAAPDRDAVLEELARRIDGSVFTAHNAAFDWAFISRAARKAGIDLPHVDRLCTLRLSRRLDPDRQLSHRLPDVCMRYAVTNQRPHDALHDAIATAQVLPHLLTAHAISDPSQLANHYER